MVDGNSSSLGALHYYSTLLDFPNAQSFVFDPWSDLLTELSEVRCGAVFVVERGSIIIRFVQENFVWQVGIKAHIELMAPGFFFDRVLGLKQHGFAKLCYKLSLDGELNAHCTLGF